MNVRRTYWGLNYIFWAIEKVNLKQSLFKKNIPIELIVNFLYFLDDLSCMKYCIQFEKFLITFNANIWLRAVSGINTLEYNLLINGRL